MFVPFRVHSHSLLLGVIHWHCVVPLAIDIEDEILPTSLVISFFFDTICFTYLYNILSGWEYKLQVVMASRTIVSKFGGSSCGSAEAYRRLGKYFADQYEAGHKQVGVFSAMFAVTDRLLNAIQSARAGDSAGVAESRAAIWDLHSRTARDLLVQPGNVDESLDWIDFRLKEWVWVFGFKDSSSRGGFEWNLGVRSG